MNVLALGVSLTGKSLFAPIDEDKFQQDLVDGLRRNAGLLQRTTKLTASGFAFKEAIPRVVDLGDPVSAGWSFLVSKTDPELEEINKTLLPLALRRGMINPNEPLMFNGEPPEDWLEWLQDNYYALDLEGKKAPHYILIAGGPDRIPFHFQSILETVANVGRVAFDSIQDLRSYIEKLLRLEAAADPVVSAEAVFFAPDAGYGDPTYFSRQYMAKPISDHVETNLKFKVQKILGPEATKNNLLAALSEKTPALVYTASHGLGALNEPLETQKRYNGAICCQHTGDLSPQSLFTGEEIPQDEPFLEGAVFFQFACFGYGTPSESDYAHWLGQVPERYTSADFVASIPKRLLAHPRGPIAFIGHLDTAFLHAFADPQAPETVSRWHNRIAPFVKAVDQLLGVQPLGQAMQDMGKRYSLYNTLITSTYDRERRGKLSWTPEERARFMDAWITRSDAQNYMVFGDPAARLRIPD
jgi:hypothetical protein